MKEMNNIENVNDNLSVDLITNNGEPSQCLINSNIYFELKVPFHIIKGSTIEIKVVSFFGCHFHQSFSLQQIDQNIIFQDCIFHSEVNFNKASFKGNTRFRNCEFRDDVKFRNTTFNGLADFWKSVFLRPVTFYKTDFNKTTVFSSVTFKENVLFTYSLFGGKTIFGRTLFEKGLDISQTIIAGELQIFDLKFKHPKYKAEYVGSDNDKFQNYIDNQHKIPQINKVTTFQILKNQYAKQGNHIDEITMRKEEKKAFYELTQSRKNDINLKGKFYGDRFILWLNKYSNNYKSDFRIGILFTAIVAVLFLSLTLLTTGEFWNRICFNCKFDSNVIGFIIKSFVNFLNPVHKATYIDGLKPMFGFPYIFDFLGRIAVGFGFYQTIQAFRKYK